MNTSSRFFALAAFATGIMLAAGGGAPARILENKLGQNDATLYHVCCYQTCVTKGPYCEHTPIQGAQVTNWLPGYEPPRSPGLPGSGGLGNWEIGPPPVPGWPNTETFWIPGDNNPEPALQSARCEKANADSEKVCQATLEKAKRVLALTKKHQRQKTGMYCLVPLPASAAGPAKMLNCSVFDGTLAIGGACTCLVGEAEGIAGTVIVTANQVLPRALGASAGRSGGRSLSGATRTNSRDKESAGQGANRTRAVSTGVRTETGTSGNRTRSFSAGVKSDTGAGGSQTRSFSAGVKSETGASGTQTRSFSAGVKPDSSSRSSPTMRSLDARSTMPMNRDRPK